jgi:hypothetical protein
LLLPPPPPLLLLFPLELQSEDDGRSLAIDKFAAASAEGLGSAPPPLPPYMLASLFPEPNMVRLATVDDEVVGSCALLVVLPPLPWLPPSKASSARVLLLLLLFSPCSKDACAVLRVRNPSSALKSATMSWWARRTFAHVREK